MTSQLGKYTPEDLMKQVADAEAREQRGEKISEAPIGDKTFADLTAEDFTHLRHSMDKAPKTL